MREKQRNVKIHTTKSHVLKCDYSDLNLNSYHGNLLNQTKEKLKYIQNTLINF